MRRLVDEVFDVATFFFALLELKNNSVAFFRQQNKLQYLFVFFHVDEEGEITSVRGCGQIFQNLADILAVFVKRSPDNAAKGNFRLESVGGFQNLCLHLCVGVKKLIIFSFGG